MKQLIYLLFASFILYYLQGILYEQNTSMSVTFLLIYFAICGWGICKVVMNGGNAYSKVLLFFICLQVLYFLFGPQTIMSVAGPIRSLSQLKAVFISLLPFFPIYYVARRRDLTNVIKVVSVGFLLFYIVQFFFMEQRLVDDLDPTQQNENVVNNAAYSFIGLFPFAFLFVRRKLVSIGWWVCCCCFLLLGAKRGAIITGGISSLIFVWYLFKDSIREKRYKALIIVCVIMGISAYYGYQYVMGNEFLIYRFEDIAQGSGRSLIYRKIFDSWNGTPSLVHFLFGFGFNSSIAIAGNYAHNDWLELLSCCGLLGVIVYAWMFWALFRYYRLYSTEETRPMLAMIIASWLCMSAFSMGYTNISLFSILLGYIMGVQENKYVDRSILKNKFHAHMCY